MKTVDLSTTLCLATLLIPGFAECTNEVSELRRDLLHTLQSDTTHYEVPDSVRIRYTVQNVVGLGIPLQFPSCPCPLSLHVMSPSDSTVWCANCVCPWIYCESDLPPGGLIILESTWDMSEITDGGAYTIRGDLHVLGDRAHFLDLPIELTVPTGVWGSTSMNTWGRIKARFR